MIVIEPCSHSPWEDIDTKEVGVEGTLWKTFWEKKMPSGWRTGSVSEARAAVLIRIVQDILPQKLLSAKTWR